MILENVAELRRRMRSQPYLQLSEMKKMAKLGRKIYILLLEPRKTIVSRSRCQLLKPRRMTMVKKGTYHKAPHWREMIL
jgi:hypothetical protein